MLNIEYVLDKINKFKSLRSKIRILNIESSKIWNVIALDTEYYKLELYGHSVVQLPDLNSILVFGGQFYNLKRRANLQMQIFNLADRTVKPLVAEKTTSSFPEQRINAQMNLETYSNTSLIVSIRGGISVETGTTLNDLWMLNIDLDGLKFNAKHIENYQQTQSSLGFTQVNHF